MEEAPSDHDDLTVALILVVVGAGAVIGASKTDDAGPILAFVGALLVALVAAYTAHRRQVTALRAERERTEMQLAHDRQLADVSDLRNTLEETLNAADRLFAAATEVLHSGSPSDDKTAERYVNSRAQLNASLVTMGHAVNAVRLRLPSSYPVVTALENLQTAAMDAGAAAYEKDEEKFDLASESLAKANKAFVRRGGSLVNSRVS